MIIKLELVESNVELNLVVEKCLRYRFIPRDFSLTLAFLRRVKKICHMLVNAKVKVKGY